MAVVGSIPAKWPNLIFPGSARSRQNEYVERDQISPFLYQKSQARRLNYF